MTEGFNTQGRTGPRTADDHGGTKRSGWLFAYSAALVLLLLSAAAYYARHWGSFAAFARGLDNCPRPFADFLLHYYPMGRSVLQNAWPVPGYFYSAFFALLLVPFGMMPILPATWAWGACQVSFIVLTGVLPFHGLLKRSALAGAVHAALIATCVPVLHNFAWGQVSVLLTACVIGSFAAHAGKRHVLAGALLAFAAAIKYYPALFLLYFLLKREVRVVAAFALSFLAFYVILPGMILGPADWAAFEKASGGAIAGAQWVAGNPNSQYFAHVVLRWLALWCPNCTAPVWGNMFRATGWVLAGLNVAAVWQMRRRDVSGECALSAAALFLALPFLSTTSWPHYLVYLPFCQTTLLLQIGGTPAMPALRRRALCGLVLLSMGLSCVLVFNAFAHWIIYSYFGLLFAANALLLPALYAISFTKVRERCRTGGTAHES